MPGSFLNMDILLENKIASFPEDISHLGQSPREGERAAFLPSCSSVGEVCEKENACVVLIKLFINTMFVLFPGCWFPCLNVSNLVYLKGNPFQMPQTQLFRHRG